MRPLTGWQNSTFAITGVNHNGKRDIRDIYFSDDVKFISEKLSDLVIIVQILEIQSNGSMFMEGEVGLATFLDEGGSHDQDVWIPDHPKL